MDKAYLQYISYYLPEDVLTNERLSESFPEWTPEKIMKKTGVKMRHIAGASETAVDMAEKAANKLFDDHLVKREDIDYVILCTQSPDYLLPTSACILQERLQLKETCGAFDYNLGCSGYIYGLGIAKGLIVSGQAKNVLLLTSETYTKYLHPEDKSCRTIFSDGAAATLVSSSRKESGFNASIGDFTFRTIGSHYNSLIVETGGSRNPIRGEAYDIRDEEGNFKRNSDSLYMDGKDIFDFSAFAVPEVINDNLVRNNCLKDDIDYFVFHQANAYMLNFVKLRAKLPAEKMIIDLEEVGNTVSSTIPIAISRKIKRDDMKEGQKLLLCGFGVGLSVGATILCIEY